MDASRSTTDSQKATAELVLVNRGCAAVNWDGSGWNARDRTVIAKMEKYLNKSGCMKLGMEELELLLGREDSEVNLRHVLEDASRWCGRIFEIFNSKEKSEHSVARKVRWDEPMG